MAPMAAWDSAARRPAHVVDLVAVEDGPGVDLDAGDLADLAADLRGEGEGLERALTLHLAASYEQVHVGAPSRWPGRSEPSGPSCGAVGYRRASVPGTRAPSVRYRSPAGWAKQPADGQRMSTGGARMEFKVLGPVQRDRTRRQPDQARQRRASAGWSATSSCAPTPSSAPTSSATTSACRPARCAPRSAACAASSASTRSVTTPPGYELITCADRRDPLRAAPRRGTGDRTTPPRPGGCWRRR